ncbi:siderophore staphylobactin biosynthesis protein SbnC [Actinomycetospora endophytica]|uniref:Siderophore staphylobactin biosynthesis protein SbnC n=1 Tax=Actinomycetospora endophytica TaxID=2291215 RepID=A0ABS8PBZ9_9PSEU|nr:IucA/IucC family protein [Actinomycetospora endophytica]MCD2195753.1 siderophore staphylobactin biosynthesis protein SbnC [Actinomycetospora endophytica]
MTQAVLRDLVDAALQEGLAEVEPPDDDGGWGRIGTARVRLRDGGALQRWRAVPGSDVLSPRGEPLTPAAALGALGLGGPGAAAAAEDLTAAAEHGFDVCRGLAALGPGPTPPDLLAGERWAATRGRPFLPTARAVSGWTTDEVRLFGPMRTEPLSCAWVAVARDHLRLGAFEGSADLAHAVLGEQRSCLDDALRRAGIDDRTHQPLPVHPWQRDHVLSREFAPEIAAGLVVDLEVELGRLHPTSSWRTLVVADDPRTHVKLPLGVATLGAARLLPPRYLDNGDRAERLLRHVVAADPELTRLVGVCDEGRWAGWNDGTDEFDDRPGHLAAQIRRYPVDDGHVALPLGALAADAWDELGPALGVGDPPAFFAGLAEEFLVMVVGFLARGVLPEVHGQNVVVRLAPGGAVVGFVLRDHDAVRIHPPWLDAAGVADPGYRIRPGARQSLRLDAPEELVAYAQTLGVQVALYAVADALARRFGVPERTFWDLVRAAVEGALRREGLPSEVTAVLERVLLEAATWPSRTVLGPLLAHGRSGSVSMPAGQGTVPNPLRCA